MSKANYIATCKNAGEALEKTYDKAESAMSQSRKWSKEAGKTDCEVFKEVNGARIALCSYLDGKVTKATGGKTAVGIVAEFEQRPGSNRDKVLQLLAKNVNEDVLSSDLQITLYGEINDSAKDALAMVIKGLRMAIDSLKLGYHIVMEKGEHGSVVSLREGKAPAKVAKEAKPAKAPAKASKKKS